MKKTFVKPTLKSYALNKKESIAASATWSDGTMSMRWLFHQYDSNHQPITHAEGCFDILDNFYPPSEVQLANEGAWNRLIAMLTRYDDPENPDHSDSAKQDWQLYTGCRNPRA